MTTTRKRKSNSTDTPATDYKSELWKMADAFHAWLGKEGSGEYADVPGFCKSTSLEEIRKHGHLLTPGRYVGAAPQEDDGEPFEEKMTRLAAQWRTRQSEANRLDGEIEANLQRLGFRESKTL